jgi:hypothetical protein
VKCAVSPCAAGARRAVSMALPALANIPAVPPPASATQCPRSDFHPTFVAQPMGTGLAAGSRCSNCWW